MKTRLVFHELCGSCGFAIGILDSIAKTYFDIFLIQCYDKMGHAIATQAGLSIEYDESVCCDVCQSVSFPISEVFK